MTKHNRFKAGSAVFMCVSCERNTRDTGQGVEHLCMECFEIAGYDNQVNDDGHKSCPADILAICNDHLARIIVLGGNGERVKGLNDYIWTTDENNSDKPVAPDVQMAEGTATESKPTTTQPKKEHKMSKKLSKTDKARNIVKKFDDGRAAGELVAKIMATCELNKPAARTYLYNARIHFANEETAVDAAKAQKTSRKPLTRAQKDAKNAARKAKRAAGKKAVALTEKIAEAA